MNSVASLDISETLDRHNGELGGVGGVYFSSLTLI